MFCNIFCLGSLWSGSGVVFDLLKEYPREVGLVLGEFNDFRGQGLIGDRISGRISNIYPSNVIDFIDDRKKEKEFAFSLKLKRIFLQIFQSR